MFRTETVEGELRLPGHHRAGEDRFADSTGGVVWMLHPPARRAWSATGCLERVDPVGHRIEEDDAGARVVVEERAEIDLVSLSPAAAAALESDRSRGMTVIGSFAPLGGPADLGAFFVGSSVLDTTDFGGRRCPSEQTALSLYRIARRRGGPFWSGVATAVADVVARRVVEAPAGRPVHDLLGRGECHARFLADAVLLLLADGRESEAASGLAGLVGMSTPWRGGVWHRHDSVEADAGRNDLVLNTHLHTTVAARAAGADVRAALDALDVALELPSERGRGVVLAGMLAVSDRLRAYGRGHGLAHRAEQMAARSRSRSPHLRLPGGWLARDAAHGPAPSYFVVNLSDLAVLERVSPTPSSSAALRRGLRFAAASGHFTAQRRDGDKLSVLVPSLLRNAGRLDAARRAADATIDAGWAPAVGWPGYEDQLWSTLPEGTP